MDLNMDSRISRPFGKSEWLKLASALVCACLIRLMAESEFLPGAGMAAVFLIFLAAGLFTREGRARFRRGDVFMICVSALLSLSYGVFMSVDLRIVCFPVTCACIAWTLFSVSGNLPGKAMSAESLIFAVRRLPGACFRFTGKPFSALVGLKKTRGLLAGALISVPVVLAAGLLLISADDVFASFATGIRGVFKHVTFGTVVLDAFVFGIMLILFSFLYSLSLAKKPEAEEKRDFRPQAVFALPLALLDALYVLFALVQFVYLFGGRESAVMEGGYAGDARKGFFELALVCFINLSFSALAFRTCGFQKALRCLTAGLYAATAVMLASSAMRMTLYVQAYGLSFLRLITFWGIFAMALADGFAFYRLIFPEKKVFSRAAAAILASFLLFVYANPEAVVANWNVKNASVEEVDTSYLSSLSPDALRALDRLADLSDGAAKAADEIRSRYESVPVISAGFTLISGK